VVNMFNRQSKYIWETFLGYLYCSVG